MITILWDFAYLFVASLALGMTFGLGIAFTLKLLRSRDSPQVLQEQLLDGRASAVTRIVDSACAAECWRVVLWQQACAASLCMASPIFWKCSLRSHATCAVVCSTQARCERHTRAICARSLLGDVLT